MTFNKIKKNKKFVYDVPSTRYIKKCIITYMSVKENVEFETIKNSDKYIKNATEFYSAYQNLKM